MPDALRSETGKQSLYDLQRVDIPFAEDLRTLLTKYDDYLRHYTPKYPEVEKLEKQIIALLERMKNAAESEIGRYQSQRWDLEKSRNRLIDDFKQYSISQRVDEDKESDYGIYRKLYDDMKVRLEQAQTARDLGNKGADRFVIIDPAYVPMFPSKPNRPQIILGGIGIGIFLGFLTVILRELLDTTIRRPSDIDIYQKPVIAFITEGDEKK